MRHPRTLIGVESDGTIWMAAIDGRQPQYSIGMRDKGILRRGPPNRLPARVVICADGKCIEYLLI